MKAVILAGGRGVRLKSLTDKIPKSLIKIGGKPILLHQILLLKRFGVRDIWILSGYLGEKIKDYLDSGDKWGVNIHHLIESTKLGTAGALKQLEGKIKNDFVVFSGDVVLDFDIDRLIKFHKKQKGLATIVVHPSDHPFDSDLVEVDANYRVTVFVLRQKKSHLRNIIFRNLTNAGVFVFSPRIFKYIKKGKSGDIEIDIFPKVLKSGDKVFAYRTSEYIKDMGTFDRLKKVRRDYMAGKIKRLNLKNKQKAIFLDRDGTINDRGEGDVIKQNDYELYPFAAEAIRKINLSEYLAIVITNQPGIAKGLITTSELDSTHKKLETELGQEAAKIDAIYFCPHHPEGGFRGEIRELKIDCSCRKPKMGLLKLAVRDFNVDLKNSFLIGDSTVDAKTAKNAGVKFIGVATGYALGDGRYPISKDVGVKANLLEAVSSILKF